MQIAAEHFQKQPRKLLCKTFTHSSPSCILGLRCNLRRNAPQENSQVIYILIRIGFHDAWMSEGKIWEETSPRLLQTSQKLVNLSIIYHKNKAVKPN